jgi:hypothetical protein
MKKLCLLRATGLGFTASADDLCSLTFIRSGCNLSIESWSSSPALADSMSLSKSRMYPGVSSMTHRWSSFPGLLHPAITCAASATRLFRARQHPRAASANRLPKAIDERSLNRRLRRRPIRRVAPVERFVVRVVHDFEHDQIPRSKPDDQRPSAQTRRARTTSSRWLSRDRCHR